MCVTDASFAARPSSESLKICEICGPCLSLLSPRGFPAGWREWEIELRFHATLDGAQSASRTPGSFPGSYSP